MEHRERTEDFHAPPWQEDFPQRLARLIELTGLSWQELAERLGVTERSEMKWRRGGMPSRPKFWAIMELACDVPGGFQLKLRGHVGADDGAEG